MFLARQVRDGEMTPTWFRVAWYDYFRRVGIAFPVGIHWLASWIHRFWTWTYKHTKPSAWELACCQVRDQVRKEFKTRIEHDADTYDKSVKEYETITRIFRDAKLELLTNNSVIVFNYPTQLRNTVAQCLLPEMEEWSKEHDIKPLILIIPEDSSVEVLDEAEMNAAGWYRKPQKTSNA